MVMSAHIGVAPRQDHAIRMKILRVPHKPNDLDRCPCRETTGKTKKTSEHQSAFPSFCEFLSARREKFDQLGQAHPQSVRSGANRKHAKMNRFPLDFLYFAV